jgi:hypothetical protein
MTPVGEHARALEPFGYTTRARRSSWRSSPCMAATSSVVSL